MCFRLSLLHKKKCIFMRNTSYIKQNMYQCHRLQICRFCTQKQLFPAIIDYSSSLTLCVRVSCTLTLTHSMCHFVKDLLSFSHFPWTLYSVDTGVKEAAAWSSPLTPSDAKVKKAITLLSIYAKQTTLTQLYKTQAYINLNGYLYMYAFFRFLYRLME